MVNKILSICCFFFISFGSCLKEKDVQISKKYAFVSRAYTENNKNYIDVDYVQYFIGDKAIEEAKKNGEADSRIVNGEKVYSIPGDFYIINKNNKIRKLEVFDNIKLDIVNSKNENVLNTFDDFKNDYKDKLFLLTIENGKVIEIREIFTP